MSSQTAARRYASALADVLTARNEQGAVREELDAWERIILDTPLLREVFTNPTIPYEHKDRVLGELIARTKVRQTTANFLRLLLKNQRLTQLPEVNEKLAQVLDERAGVVSAEVTSARAVSEPLRSALQEALTKITRKKVSLSFQTDETLLGGIVTRIGSTIYDGSVRNQLKRLSDELAGH